MKYCCLCGGEGHLSKDCPWRVALLQYIESTRKEREGSSVPL